MRTFTACTFNANKRVSEFSKSFQVPPNLSTHPLCVTHRRFTDETLKESVGDWTTSISETGMQIISDIYTTREWSASEREAIAEYIVDNLFDGTGCKGINGSFVLTEVVYELD
jgi:hypothetical protein